MIPLINRTHYSLLQGYSKPKELAKACVEYGYKACGLADFNTLAGTINFMQAMRKVGVKPVIGTEIKIGSSKVIAYAKNKDGWKSLIKITYKEPSIDEFVEHSKNLAVVSYDDSFDDKIKDVFHTQPSGKRPIISKETRFAYEKDFEDAELLYRVGHGIGVINDKFMPPFSSCLYSSEEEKNSNTLVDMIEDIELTSRPLLPKFEWTNGMTEPDYLRHLCRKGWQKKIQPILKTKEEQNIYADRVKYELEVIQGAGLDGYFLIVQDIMEWARQRFLCGPARGSAGGSLVAYLLDITLIDPIQHGLIFERFYNAGRNTKDRVSLPDIDSDFPVSKRDDVIAYIKDRYGHDRVASMATLVSLKGRGALQEVLRAHKACSFEEIKKVTAPLPHEHEINDQMEDSGHTSIIDWVLEFDPSIIKDYCRLEDGKYVGDYANYFQQAARIEGTFKSMGQHASGIIVTDEPTDCVCPVIDRKGETLAAMEMGDLEALGCCKLDLLGVSILDKLINVNKLLLGK